MRVLTVGDSFTYGDELININDAWPYVLQTKMSCELTNLGKSSTGNTSMVRNVIEHAADYDLIIVAWSHFARIEFADKQGIYDTWPGHRGIMFTGNTAHRTELLNYINHHHNDEYLYKQYLLNVVLLQKYVDQLGKRMLMLSTHINWNKSSDKLLMARVEPITKQIDTQNFLGFPNESMMDWTFGSPKGSGGHFLTAGHKIVADKIYEYIRNLGWLS